MRLKRGLPRESCDFCHRRKIKCDRSVRAKQGLASCSQCALRRGPCLLSDPTETRIRRHGSETPGGEKADIDLSDMVPSSAGVRPTDDNHTVVPFGLASSLEPPLPLETDASALVRYPDNTSVEDYLGLSADNIYYLDQVFMDSSGGNMEWFGHTQTPRRDTQEPTSVDGQHSDNEDVMRDQTEESQLFSWLDSVADSNTALTAALHCYFKFAAPWLPILLEDAFWQDYRNGWCSPVLVSAVACRGMPFTTVSDKWDLQQRFARDFREAFLKAQTMPSNDGITRLDDLEALALMVNFEYEEIDSPPLHSNLGRLFLRHESLVMMMLQNRIQDRISTGSGSSVLLTRARERRVLLHWHVYGLDAFHCLDRKQISLIPDRDASDKDGFSQHATGDYFDAVLELAAIARKILLRLCSNMAKRHGIEPNDVHDAYTRLYQWRDHTCPPHLRRYEQSPGIVSTQNNHTGHSSEPQRYLHLHRAVLWALEINCLMQIDSYVSDFGLSDSGSLQAEMTTARVEYESLRALNDMVAICRWIDEHALCDEDGKQHSLIDLAPLALRNVCAGLCFWICQRSTSSQFPSMRASLGRKVIPPDGQRHPARAQLVTARLLREAAAKAKSHRDTASVLERLDNQIALLGSSVDCGEQDRGHESV